MKRYKARTYSTKKVAEATMPPPQNVPAPDSYVGQMGLAKEAEKPKRQLRNEIIKAEGLLLAVDEVLHHFRLEIDWEAARKFKDALAAAITKARLDIH